jgi:hypothetical protein
MRRADRAWVLFLIGGSVATAAIVALLATNEIISPEWFFGGPLIGVVASSIWIASRREFLVSPVERPREESERFVAAHRLLEAEQEIAFKRSEEIRRTLRDLEAEKEGTSLYDYLGRDRLVYRLREAEARLVEAERRIEELSREEASAHARLIVTAQAQGVPKAHERDPYELVREVVRATNPD